MPAHPLAAVMNHGVPVTLCSDDPSAFGNMGLSYDFFQVLVASEQNGLKTMGCLARDSFKVSIAFRHLMRILILDDTLLVLLLERRREGTCDRTMGQAVEEIHQLARARGVWRCRRYPIKELTTHGPVSYLTECYTHYTTRKCEE